MNNNLRRMYSKKNIEHNTQIKSGRNGPETKAKGNIITK